MLPHGGREYKFAPCFFGTDGQSSDASWHGILKIVMRAHTLFLFLTERGRKRKLLSR